ncbi:hypothetical protein [Gordonia aichiensis]|uniref:hypothetical protein n=1 Tax=Gordonia aichiensis TaxID=36820 RepID=UPI0032653C6A
MGKARAGDATEADCRAAVAAHLADHDGVITSAEALRLGLSRRQIKGRLDRGDWASIVTGVHRSAAHPLTESVLVRAAVAAHRGVADRTTAAWWHGLLDDLPFPMTISALDRTRPDRWPLGPVDLIRRRHLPDDVTQVRGLPITRLPATALFTSITVDHGSRFLDRVLQTGAVTVDELAAVVERNSGCKGMGAARRLLAVASDDSESEAERIFARLLREAGITGWVQQYRFGPWRLDFAWPEREFAVEIDGWAFHHQHDRFRSDRAKLNALDDALWRKKVCTWHEITDEAATCIAEVLGVLNAAPQ